MMLLYPDTTPPTSESNVSREMQIRGAYLKKMLKKAGEDSILITFDEPHLRESTIGLDILAGKLEGDVQADNVTLKDLETGATERFTTGVGTITVQPNRNIAEDIIYELQARYDYENDQDLRQAVDDGLEVELIHGSIVKDARILNPTIKVPKDYPIDERPPFIIDDIELELTFTVWYPDYSRGRPSKSLGEPLKVKGILADIHLYGNVHFGD